MRIAIVFGIGIITAALTAALATAAEDGGHSDSPQTTTAPSVAQPPSKDETAIRQIVDAFVKNYNAHDAAAIGLLFTADGQIADEEGKVAKGPKAIGAVFAEVFKEHPETRIENTIESIQMVGPGEAVEDGTAIVTHDEKTPAEKTRYRAVHVKQGGKWQMISCADLPDDAWTGGDQLRQLEWMIGDWMDESHDVLVLTSYRWTDNHRFILSEFVVQIDGRPAMIGTQRIGWDPLKKTLRSWTFDSEGGFAEGVWTREANQWIIQSTGVARSGKSASATTTITQLGKDRIATQRSDRVVDGEKMPDGKKIIIVRRPPAPTDR